MKSTRDQALLKAVEAHKAGKLQDAESLYRAILQAQPKHPDANHNLGVLAVSLNKIEAALPLFKTALEANPNQGQFWLSYIDALIKVKQFDIARSVFEQGKRRGFTGEKVDLLEAQFMTSLLTPNSELISINNPSTTSQQLKNVSAKKEKKKNVSTNLTEPNQIKSPPHVEINDLLEYYQKGQHDLALNLATALTQQYPNHPFGWKVLGALFKQTGKLQDSVIANQKVLEISPDDAEAHSNLGATLQELGRLEDAAASYKKAIAIKPDYAEAYCNLGNTLKELGRLENAETCYKKAIAIKPDYAEAYYNLGNTLKVLGRLEDAETCFNKAISTKPDYAQAHYNLGNTLKELGRLEDAKTSYKKAIVIKPDYAEAHCNLGITFSELDSLDDAEISYKKAISIKPNLAEAHSNLGNTLKELGRLEDAETSYKKAISIKPDYAEAHYNLGNTLKELGRLEDAKTSYSKTIAIKPDLAEAHCNLGNILKELGRLEDAETSYKKAIVIKPDLAEAYCNLGDIYLYKNQPIDAYKHIRIALYHSPKLATALLIESLALSRLVPLWHVPMVNEKKRNDAYYFALEAVINPNSSVFEIGTGSGLLSMMAAKMNVKKITTCESNPIIAEKANTIITNNGYRKVINLLSKKSTDVILDVDLSEKSNVLVSEIFSSELLGEGVLHAIEDVKRRLLTLDAKIIPATASIMVSMFGGEEIQDILYIKDSYGLRIEEFNSIVSKKITLINNQLPIKLFADEVEAFRFEFESKSYFPTENKTLNLPIKSSGVCCGVIQWIRLEMTKDIFYENHPTDGTTVSGWQQIAYIFKEPIEIREGQTAVVFAQHDRNAPWFSLQTIKG
jgi:tetratricopeptide (TPR) repeat protein